MLVRMLCGDVPAATDGSGATFVDRDGGRFAHVLDYLRDGERAALPADDVELGALLVEASRDGWAWAGVGGRGRAWAWAWAGGQGPSRRPVPLPHAPAGIATLSASL